MKGTTYDQRRKRSYPCWRIAEAMALKGIDIRILSEAAFFKMLDA